ncbi:DUF2325 domain-containing protein [uncultured Aquitalea sp.]|uniref:DUF2325 domain-containing protein n=1 Tax=uncultured Aquitalea sp. TaxID=540272 RepID=UPI0025E10762|nr:DUF2325 domain-containing protein [uncultured Aquitalea sp.]
MKAMIIGGDKVDTTRRALLESGFADIVHWTGRKTNDLRRQVPGDIDHIVIMLDYCNHNLAKRMRDVAREQRIGLSYVGRRQQADRAGSGAVLKGALGVLSAH